METVLLVEDNVTLAYFAARNLANAIGGWEIAIAGSCAEAVSKAELLRPSVLIVDVGLADGNGIELAVRLSERFPGMRTIVTSGKEATGQEIAGFFGFLAKPYEAGALIEMVRRAISAGVALVNPVTERKIEESGEFRPPAMDRHKIKNKLAGLLAGLRTLQGDLIAESENPAEVRSISRAKIDCLCEDVKEVSDLLSMESGWDRGRRPE